MRGDLLGKTADEWRRDQRELRNKCRRERLEGDQRLVLQFSIKGALHNEAVSF